MDVWAFVRPSHPLPPDWGCLLHKAGSGWDRERSISSPGSLELY